ncbi:SDR family oxidoreductase [Nonomuraea mesophila]|uniref:SDR family oxidoreductase n=1 Tax=Nonomuraea mesophila TaxID=2530382 RepID=A0A4R5F7U8_9ACTN|nr:SDR family oxidoreductase [Nonomuraea mesophila]
MLVSRLTDRHAVVTGAASGIGWEIARLFHAEGAAVSLIDSDDEGVRARAAELGERAFAASADVTEEVPLERSLDAAVRAFGPPRVCVNSAGVSAFGPIARLTLREWRRVVDVCLTGVFLSVKHEARRMTGGGSIVNIASLTARRPAEGFAAYCAAKAGVEMFTQVAAMELGAAGIRVNALAPGVVPTPLSATLTEPPLRDGFVAATPLGRMGEPADIAPAALFLASDDSSWITGDLLMVDGGAHTRGYPDAREFLLNARRGQRR